MWKEIYVISVLSVWKADSKSFIENFKCRLENIFINTDDALFYIIDIIKITAIIRYLIVSRYEDRKFWHIQFGSCAQTYRAISEQINRAGFHSNVVCEGSWQRIDWIHSQIGRQFPEKRSNEEMRYFWKCIMLWNKCKSLGTEGKSCEMVKYRQQAFIWKYLGKVIDVTFECHQVTFLDAFEHTRVRSFAVQPIFAWNKVEITYGQKFN